MNEFSITAFYSSLHETEWNILASLREGASLRQVREKYFIDLYIG